MARRVPREWKTYEYIEPREVLIAFREIERQFAGSGIDEKTFRLRTNDLKRYREWRQALLFAYGMQTAALHVPVHVACVEREDFDCIMTFRWQGVTQFVPVQIKELAPADLNQNADLQSEIAKLEKYASSEDLVVAFHLNRDTRVEFNDLRVPPLRLRELWFFGAMSPAQDEWLLYGNALGAPGRWTYQYPA